MIWLYSYIPFFIKYAENTNLGWQKQIGIETFGELLSNTIFLSDMFNKNNNIYEDLFNSLFKISNDIIEHCNKKNIMMNLKKWIKLRKSYKWKIDIKRWNCFFLWKIAKIRNNIWKY